MMVYVVLRVCTAGRRCIAVRFGKH